MATITTTTYRSDDSGKTWYSRPSGTSSYINQKGSANQTCFSFSYTPTSGNKISKIVLTCSIMAQSGYSWNGPYTAELHLATLPDGNSVAISAQVSPSLTNTAYKDVSFTLNIPESVTIDSTSNLCIAVYGPYSVSYNGRAEVTEIAGYKPVYIGNSSVHDQYVVYIADTENGSSSMPVEVSNVGARGIYRQNGTISYGNDWNVIQTLVGYYSTPSTNYAMQLRFRLNKPCTSIRLCAQGASGTSGTYYFKVSNNIQDNALLNRMFDQGHTSEDTPISIAWNGTSYCGEATIEGDFPANTDLYIYCYQYSTSHNAKHLFGLYDSNRYSKVIGATAVAGTEDKQCTFSKYAVYVGDGTNWVKYGG